MGNVRFIHNSSELIGGQWYFEVTVPADCLHKWLEDPFKVCGQPFNRYNMSFIRISPGGIGGSTSIGDMGVHSKNTPSLYNFHRTFRYNAKNWNALSAMTLAEYFNLIGASEKEIERSKENYKRFKMDMEAIKHDEMLWDEEMGKE